MSTIEDTPMSATPTPRTDAINSESYSHHSEGYSAMFEHARELECELAAAAAIIAYAKRLGLHIAIGTSTDCPEGRLQHTFIEGTELSRLFDEWSDSIGWERKVATAAADKRRLEEENAIYKEALEWCRDTNACDREYRMVARVAVERGAALAAETKPES
jgi:hypothetical protein